MIRIVLDTNVLVSAALTPNGNAARIVNLISVNAEIQVYYSMNILAEYKDVLSRPRLNIVTEKQTRAVNAITKMGIMIDPVTSNVPLPDESDRIFYDTAKESESILITGNAKHYPKEDSIITPSQFLDRVKEH